MESKCVVCHDRPAQFRCVQCHKPVCDECAFKNENGVFCSRSCAAAYRDYQQAGSGSARSGGMMKTLIILIIVAAVAAAVAHYLELVTIPGLPTR
ncbi:MAG: B-box zinc finger protein [Candidatus Brocadiia bacterium]